MQALSIIDLGTYVCSFTHLIFPSDQIEIDSLNSHIAILCLYIAPLWSVSSSGLTLKVAASAFAKTIWRYRQATHVHTDYSQL